MSIWGWLLRSSKRSEAGCDCKLLDGKVHGKDARAMMNENRWADSTANCAANSLDMVNHDETCIAYRQ